ncbi:ATPase, P-type (transporting), HAD superfamily, subfamily IC [Cellulophaga algicola DSM 14237]|uniref:ATPase, P-type (Transporting), HAD superfamily, subfamily IC n=1 Tax=Cellulophaga algicola (strain DSM 14237 / IC166 / ACAM 630) TaxID=688270 RepID=E6XEC4_CELAD|nr:cation-translocating P-type ATPase [Cellulophaga algicola]ADV50214.1 ATPase, P-type (transporting), HAD superfamily, subfamily IC [Cellulophaga algicola DSM 14237]
MTTFKDTLDIIENTYSKKVDVIVNLLDVDLKTGLQERSINDRIAKYGLNSYREQKQKSILLILFEQFKSPIILLLVVAAGFSFFFEDWLEGFSIIAVIFITVVLGFIMELQARNSMKALKKMDVSVSKVWRDNSLKEIQAERIVPGDVLVLEAGDIVMADARLIEVNQFEIDESALTGESLPVEKKIEVIKNEVPLADKINLIFKGTSVVKGNARAIVTGTGVHTELGKITHMVATAKQGDTPLEKKIQGITKILMVVTAVFAGIFIITGLLQGKQFYLIVETALALAVAAIPEGLPVVSIIALTYGMLRLAKKNVLIKRLASVETLGGVNIIFTDKTGTLTENKIDVNKLMFFDEDITIAKKGDDSSIVINKNKGAYEKLILISILCNNAASEQKENKKKYLGDPIEIALLQFVNTSKVNVEAINATYPRIAEEPFNSETKLMATLHKNNAGNFVAAKGAVEKLIDTCSFYSAGDRVIPLTEAAKKDFLNRAETIEAQGSKVLAFAFKEAANIPTTNFLSGLTLVGLIGFLDPPRMEVVEALQSCRNAGIKVIMITGDHPATALNIAEKIKLSEKDNVVINGKELDSKLSDKKLFAATIFARVTPKQKLAMVSFYQKHGSIVAMTGDGINDAPALKKADIGIAMGIRGTQVAKETAAMILKDDSFTSIVTAIMQGRVIFKNIKNFLMYLLSCNLSEIFIVFFYGLLNFPFSVLPLQILFLNLVTDIFPALALGLGKGNDLIMKIPPRNPQQPIVIKRDWFTINVYAVLLALPILLVTWYCSHYLKYDAKLCNNITFFSLALSQLWHVLNLPSRKISFLNNEITRNKFTWAASLLCISIMAVFYFVSPLNNYIGLQKLSIDTWLIITFTSMTPVFLIQLFKRIFKIID